jgi:hypothetical protein
VSSFMSINRKILNTILISCFCCFSIIPLFAQDANYWTHQYGTRSTLLGGAVVGSVLDLSGTYYNPGGLALIDKPATIEAAKVFQHPDFILRGPGKIDFNFSTSTLESAPSLLAGSISLKGLDNHWVGYSFLARQYVSTGIIGSFLFSRDVLPDPGIEALSSNLRLNIKLTESWFGLSWAYRFKKTIGIGISPFLLVRNHNSSIQTLAQALTLDGRMSLVLNDREYSYVNYRILWKMGAAFDFDRITLGLTLTTPSLKIYGKGSTGVNRTVAGLDINDDSTRDDYLANNHQDKLNANYKTPLSLGIGLTYKFKKIRIYGSAEWFAGMAKYLVMKGKEFLIQSTGEMKPIDVSHKLDDVLNYGIGIEYIFTPKLKAYASFTTDFSAADPESDTNFSVASWDIYHTMAGADFTLGRISFTLGIGYATGRHRAEPFTEEEISAAREFLMTALSGLEFEYSSIKFVIGFAF